MVKKKVQLFLITERNLPNVLPASLRHTGTGKPNHAATLRARSSASTDPVIHSPRSRALSPPPLHFESPSKSQLVGGRRLNSLGKSLLQVPRSMALVTTGSGVEPVIAEVEMNASSDSGATTVRATVVQASTVFYDTLATLDKAERLIAEAAEHGAQLVVFPEAFVGGYPRGSTFGFGISISLMNPKDKGKEAFRRYHASAIDVPGPEVTHLAAVAGKYKVFLVMGVIEREGYTLYCSVLFFDPLGRYLGKHRKLMPTALERIIWGFGDGSTIPVYDTPLGKIGALICWENKMPLLRTALYGKGIEIYCTPTADSRPVWQASMTHIALEGGCFVLSANQFCRRKDYPLPPEYEFAGLDEVHSPETVVCPGGSVIISPSGQVLAGPNYEGEALITA